MTKFFTSLLNLRSSIKMDLVKQPFFIRFDRLSTYLFSTENIVFSKKIYCIDIQKNLLINSNYIGIQFHFNI